MQSSSHEHLNFSYRKIVQSGHLIEVYDYEKSPNPSRNKKRKRSCVACITASYLNNHRKTKCQNCLKKGIYRKPRVARSVQRAKNAFRRMVYATLPRGDAAFATLTMASSESLSTSYREFSRFTVYLRRLCGSGTQWIAVPEFHQKDDRVHFHCLIWGVSNELIYNEAPWSSYQGNSRRQVKRRNRFISFCEANGYDPHQAIGTRDLQACWSRGWLDILRTDDSPKLASYMAKYMSKTMSDNRIAGNKSYSASRGCVRSVLLNSPLQIEVFSQEWPEVDDVDNKLDSVDDEKVYSTQWLGRCRYRKITKK